MFSIVGGNEKKNVKAPIRLQVNWKSNVFFPNSGIIILSQTVSFEGNSQPCLLGFGKGNFWMETTCHTSRYGSTVFPFCFFKKYSAKLKIGRQDRQLGITHILAEYAIMF